jgi:hypothetical protein
MVAKLLTVGALCVRVEAKTTFSPEGFGVGAKAGLGSEVLGFGACGDNGDSGCRFACSFVVSGEPSWFFRKGEASVKGGELFAYVGQGEGGGEAVH